MVGFTVEYDAYEIEVDGVEIVWAELFDTDNLPNISRSISISRKLID
jgi:NADH pyrophosphatase NudC (nudix superfamily)